MIRKHRKVERSPELRRAHRLSVSRVGLKTDPLPLREAIRIARRIPGVLSIRIEGIDRVDVRVAEERLAEGLVLPALRPRFTVFTRKGVLWQEGDAQSDRDRDGREYMLRLPLRRRVLESSASS